MTNEESNALSEEAKLFVADLVPAASNGPGCLPSIRDEAFVKQVILFLLQCDLAERKHDKAWMKCAHWIAMIHLLSEKDSGEPPND